MNVEKFDQKEYIKNFNKKNYVGISCRVKPTIKKEFDILIQKNGFRSYSDFIEKSIEVMKKSNTPLKK